MKSLLSKYIQTLKAENTRDKEFIKMKNNYTKALYMVDAASQ